MQYLVYQHVIIIKKFLIFFKFKLMFYILFFVLHIGNLGCDTT